MSQNRKLSLQDHQFFTLKRLAPGQSISDIAREQLPPRARSDKNILAMSRQIMLKNGISEAQARRLPSGKVLTVPVIENGLRSAEQLARLGQSIETPVYNYQRPEIWLRRWVSLMRSIKTTLGLIEDIIPEMVSQAEEYITEYPEDLPPKFSPSKNDLIALTTAITQTENGLPETRSGLVRYILSYICQTEYLPGAVDDALIELKQLQEAAENERRRLTQLNAEIKEKKESRIDIFKLYYELKKREVALNIAEKERKGDLSTIGEAQAPIHIEVVETWPDARMVYLAGTAEPNQGLQFILNNEVVVDYHPGDSVLSSAVMMPDGSSFMFNADGMWELQLELTEVGDHHIYIVGTNGYDQLSEEKIFELEDGVQGVMTEVRVESPSEMAWDLEFELRQLFVLYRLCRNLGIFVDEELGPRTAASLPGHWKPRPDRVHPPTNLVHENLRRASVDVEIIQRAIIQRKRETRDGERPLTRHGESLLIADKLVIKSLAPFEHLVAGYNPRGGPINVITYYSENTHIRRLPYDRSALLVGIAYANVSAYQDDLPAYDYLLKDVYPADPSGFWPSYEFLAIPHEVGHFVYHHCLTYDNHGQATPIAQIVQHERESARFGHWYEEIFADVYGSFIAGPLTGMGIQGLLVSSSVRQMSRDDGEHPVPIFRPFIISEILRVLSDHPALPDRYRYENAPNLLDASWEDILRMRGLIPKGINRDQATFTFFQVAGDHSDHYDEDRANNRQNRRDQLLFTATITEVIDSLRPIIKTFVDFLATNVDFSPWTTYKSNLEDNSALILPANFSPDIPWSGDQSELADYDQLVKSLVTVGTSIGSVPNPQITPARKAASAKERRPVQAFHATAEADLLDNLDIWGDSGPGGFGNNP